MTTARETTPAEIIAKAGHPEFSDYHPETRKSLYEQAEEAVKALKAAGFAIVPREPTKEMIGAADPDAYRDGHAEMIAIAEREGNTDGSQPAPPPPPPDTDNYRGGVPRRSTEGAA